MSSLAMGIGTRMDAYMANENHLTADDRIVLERLLWVLETLRTLKPGIQVHMVAAFLRVALNEGKSVADLTRDAGVAQSVMSRALLDLGPMTRDRDPGLGLIEHKLAHMNLRIHEVHLTKPGVSLARKLAQMLSPAKRRN
jgi:hypothetical protein